MVRVVLENSDSRGVERKVPGGSERQPDPADGQRDRMRKHLHDIRGTFASRLMTSTNFTDRAIAGIMGWSEPEVERIRRLYVDDTARTVAIGRRIARGL